MTTRFKRFFRISPRAGFFIAGMGVSLALFTGIVSGAIPCVTPTGGTNVNVTAHTGNTNTGNGSGQGTGNGAGNNNSGNGAGNNNGNGAGQGQGTGNGNGNDLGIGVNAGGNGNGGGLLGGIFGNGSGNGSSSGSNGGSGSGAGASNGCTGSLLALTTSGLLNSCTTATDANGSLNVNHTNDSAVNSVNPQLSNILSRISLGNVNGGNSNLGGAQQLLNVSAPGLLNGSNSTSAGNGNGASQNGALTVTVNPQQPVSQGSTSASSTTSGNASANQPQRHSVIHVNAPAVTSAGNAVSVGSVSNAVSHPASATNAASSLVTVNTSQPSSSSSNDGSVLNLGL